MSELTPPAPNLPPEAPKAAPAPTIAAIPTAAASQAQVITDSANGVAQLLEKHRLQAFDVYKKFRYNDMAFSRLSLEFFQLERDVRRWVLITLTVSLAVDIVPGMNAEALRWIWGALGLIATVLTIYAMMVQSSEKQFSWFERSKRARAWASKLESFTAQVESGKIDEQEFKESMDSYNAEYNTQLGDAGPAFIDFEARSRTQLTDELYARLRSEGKAS